MGHRYGITGAIGLVVVGLLLPQDTVQSRAMPAPVAHIAEASLDEIALAVEALPADQQARYLHWTARDIRFEGPWTPDRVALVLSVLDRFADALGEERFISLVDQAVAEGSDGQIVGLTLAMTSTDELWAASWAASQGRIKLYDQLFDQAHLDAHYGWRFLDDLAEAQPEPVSLQEAIIGHELGHLLLDALRDAHMAHGHADTRLEDAYRSAVCRGGWAHPMDNTNENVATEISLWVYGVDRSRQVLDYRTEVLTPALLSLADSSTPDVAP